MCRREASRWPTDQKILMPHPMKSETFRVRKSRVNRMETMAADLAVRHSGIGPPTIRPPLGGDHRKSERAAALSNGMMRP